MPKLTQISPEISQKYTQDNNGKFKLAKVVNAVLDTYKNEPKDEINVIVGDDKQVDFMPQVKLERWSNEVNFSVRLIDNDTSKTAQVSTLQDKIIWDKGNTKIEFYEDTTGEGAYKFVWYLKAKPATNKVEFTIQSKGLNFFYQPSLTQEYQNGYSEEFQKEIVVTETQVKDLEGNVLVNRPENVVGSYVVYHSAKGGMNDVNGKDYKTGQAFFIYRPHIIDAEGKETWGILHIENGIYSVEIPQKFLDTAVYPIKSNDTLGYTTIGTSYTANSASRFRSNQSSAAGSNGTMTKIQIGAYDAGGDSKVKMALYNETSASPSSLVANSYSGEITVTRTTRPTQDSEWTSSENVSGTIVSGNTYWLAWDTADTTIYYCFNDGAITQKYVAQTYANFPTDPAPGSLSTNTFAFSIYATYTPSGGGGVTGRRIAHGFVHTGNFAVA